MHLPLSLTSFRRLRPFVALSFGLALAACQSGGAKDVIASASMPAVSATGDEILGKGGSRIALIIPRGAGGKAGVDAEEFRNGAVLALSDLGTDYLTLSVLRTNGDTSEAREKTRKAVSEGNRLIIGPSSPAELVAIAEERKSSSPPILGFVDNNARRASGVYAFLSDEIDGALAVAGHAIAAAGKRDFLIVAGPDGLSTTATARFKTGVAKTGGRYLGTVSSSGGQITGDSSLIGRADAVIMLAASEPDRAIQALRANSLGADALLLGTSSWSSQLHNNPSLAGALVPYPDRSGLQQIEPRMRAAYGKPMTMEAAYGYDAVALAAGLVRAVNDQAFSPAVLRQPVGFRGATGAFRFNEDGSVSRLHGVYRLEAKGLKLVQPAADQF